MLEVGDRRRAAKAEGLTAFAAVLSLLEGVLAAAIHAADGELAAPLLPAAVDPGRGSPAPSGQTLPR